MKDLLKFIQILLENQEIAGMIIAGVLGLTVMGFCYKIFMSIKKALGIGMLIAIIIYVVLGL